MNNHHMHQLCKQHVGLPVTVQTAANEAFHGIVEGVDDNNVYLAVPDFDENQIMGASTPNGYPMNHQPMQQYPAHQNMNNISMQQHPMQQHPMQQHSPMHQQGMDHNNMKPMMQGKSLPYKKKCGCSGPSYRDEDRQFYGYGYPYPPYGYYPYPGLGFRRLILPLAALTALSVLPWWY